MMYKLVQKGINNHNWSKEKFWIGDKVIQCRNDYLKGIVNGDIGFIRNKDKENFFIKFDGIDELVEIPIKKNQLQLAYAITVHKYQGSEAPIIMMPIHKCHGSMLLTRKTVYTAISRAKNGFICMGQDTAFAEAISRNKDENRQTKLPDFIREFK